MFDLYFIQLKTDYTMVVPESRIHIDLHSLLYFDPLRDGKIKLNHFKLFCDYQTKKKSDTGKGEYPFYNMMGIILYYFLHECACCMAIENAINGNR